MRFRDIVVGAVLSTAWTSAALSADVHSVGKWEVGSNPGQSCMAGTGYIPSEGRDGFKGIMLMVRQDQPAQVLLLVSLTVSEAQALALSETRKDVPLHLTFFNPDLGNAFVIMHAAPGPNDGSPGWDLLGVLNADGLKFLREYQTLDVYLAGTDIRLRRISLGNSGAALDALANCARTSLKAH